MGLFNVELIKMVPTCWNNRIGAYGVSKRLYRFIESKNVLMKVEKLDHGLIWVGELIM
jgi:hypothetical protein